jgi:hypothetical protein
MNGAELRSKPATDAFAVTVFAEQLGGSAIFRNKAVSRMLRDTILCTVVQLEYVSDVRVSACEYNMLLVLYSWTLYRRNSESQIT